MPLLIMPHSSRSVNPTRVPWRGGLCFAMAAIGCAPTSLCLIVFALAAYRRRRRPFDLRFSRFKGSFFFFTNALNARAALSSFANVPMRTALAASPRQCTSHCCASLFQQTPRNRDNRRDATSSPEASESADASSAPPPCSSSLSPSSLSSLASSLVPIRSAVPK